MSYDLTLADKRRPYVWTEQVQAPNLYSAVKIAQDRNPGARVLKAYIHEA